MRNLQEVIQSNQTLQRISGFNFDAGTCDKHEKPVSMTDFNGEIFCPLCEREKATAELSRKETAKIERAFRGEAYRTLKGRSILNDETIKEARFYSYITKPDEPETIRNKQAALAAVERMKAGETFNLWFNGLPGVGKSHLAYAILNELNEAGDGRSCLFVSVAQMFRLLKDSFRNRDSIYTERYFVDLLGRVDYLALDDIGAETGATDTDKRASDYTIGILKDMAEARQKKATIFTTNLSSQQLREMYDKKTVSRLLKNVEAIVFADNKTTDKRIEPIEEDPGF